MLPSGRIGLGQPPLAESNPLRLRISRTARGLSRKTLAIGVAVRGGREGSWRECTAETSRPVPSRFFGRIQTALAARWAERHKAAQAHSRRSSRTRPKSVRTCRRRPFCDFGHRDWRSQSARSLPQTSHQVPGGGKCCLLIWPAVLGRSSWESCLENAGHESSPAGAASRPHASGRSNAPNRFDDQPNAST